MCDYSLCGLPTRLAVEGEELVVHKFQTGSKGLASPSDFMPPRRPEPYAASKSLWQFIKSIFDDSSVLPAATAVCVPPGAQLILKNVPPDLQRRWKVQEEEGVFFVQLSAEVDRYRDAVRFRSGREVLLQELYEGMPVQVLSLGNATPEHESEFVLPALR
jgi:hypothetical protein